MMRVTNAQRIPSVRSGLLRTACILPLLFSSQSVRPALALSELREIPGAQQSQDTTTGQDEQQGDDPRQLPMPDPLVTKPAEDDAASTASDEPADSVPAEFLSDISQVPEPVRRLRELIVEAAASGDMERLRPLLGKGDTQTQVSQVDTDEDPVTTLRGLSGDPEGIEVMAILLDVLTTGFVKVGAGTAEEIYVWPYFTEKALGSLTPPEKVELLRLVTAGDFADMQEFGGYNFYKVGITPDGQWKFFLTGD